MALQMIDWIFYQEVDSKYRNEGINILLTLSPNNEV